MSKSDEALILIADDQPDNLDTMIGYLGEAEMSYKFSQAMNGEVACKVTEKRLPDLIIMDWEMPVMNGFDALIAIKNNPLTADIPIIMSTGRSSAKDLDRALQAGAADYIRKPIEKQELLARVRTCLNISRYIQEIKSKNEELANLNRERGAMMSIVAHDLKSPLNNIKGLAELLKLEGDLNENQEENISRIKRIAKDGRYLITDLLDIHAYEHADSTIKKSKIGLNKFISNWQLSFEQELNRKNQHLLVHDIPDNIEINTDEILLSRILDNMLTNAIKFSEKGRHIFINTLLEDDTIRISVRDEGPGISEEDQKHMYKMFQKLSAKPTDGESSNGLGLSIIKTLVGKLNGEIELKTELGKGAEFIVSLPAN